MDKDKKHRKDTLPGVVALVRQWYYNTFRSDLFEQAVKFFLNIPPAADPVTGCPPRSSRGPSAAGPPPSAASAVQHVTEKNQNLVLNQKPVQHVTEQDK